jgi:hypothetical protein
MDRHSSIYTVNVGTHKKDAESKNSVNRGYLVVLKGRKSKIAEIVTADIEECLY